MKKNIKKRIASSAEIDSEWIQFRAQFLRNHYTSSGYTGCDADERGEAAAAAAATEATATATPKIKEEQENEVLVSEPEEEEEEDALEGDSCSGGGGSSGDLIPFINTRTSDGRLNISTKSNVLKLNVSAVPYVDLFWKTPVMPYLLPREGIVRKELMVQLTTQQKADEYFRRRDAYVNRYPDQMISERMLPISSARGAAAGSGGLRFAPFETEEKYRGVHDARSLHVGVCQKEIECKKREERKAFPNCFVFYLRWSRDGGLTFEESHIKIFSTGKIDMPGINCSRQLSHVKELIQRLVFSPAMIRAVGLREDLRVESPPPSACLSSEEAKVVLVNAEFQCNFCINTTRLRDLLFRKFGLKSELKNETPGLKCALFVRKNAPLSRKEQNFQLAPEDELVHRQNKTVREQHYKITYTFFHSGEVLVSGACPEVFLLFTFDFIKEVMLENWRAIQSDAPRTNTKKAKKLRYVSKCKYTVRFQHLLDNILSPNDWRA